MSNEAIASVAAIVGCRAEKAPIDEDSGSSGGGTGRIRGRGRARGLVADQSESVWIVELSMAIGGSGNGVENCDM